MAFACRIRQVTDLRERLLDACQRRAARRPESLRLGVHPGQQLPSVFRLEVVKKTRCHICKLVPLQSR